MVTKIPDEFEPNPSGDDNTEQYDFEEPNPEDR